MIPQLPADDRGLAARLKPEDKLSNTSSFMQLRRPGNIYVDRTQHLGYFLTSGFPVHLLKRPRRSGKTTFLSTVESFLQLDDATEEARAAAFKGLAISTEPRLTEYWQRDFAKHPVVQLNFANLSVRSTAYFLRSLTAEISFAIRRAKAHGHLKNISLDALTSLTPIIQRQDDVPQTKLESALVELCEAIARSTGILPILLIDEYESPVMHARLAVLETNRSQQSVDVCLDVCASMKTIMQSLLTNNRGSPLISRCLLVGICQITHSGFLSGLNNVLVCGPRDTMYDIACLFTAEELSILYSHYLREHWGGDLPEPNFLERMKSCYSSFTTSTGVELYSPFAVIKAFELRHIGSYWTESGSDGLLQRLLNHIIKSEKACHGDSRALATFTQLLAGSEQTFVYKEAGNVDDTLTTDLFLSTMFEGDYLACSGDNPPVYKIPNKDVSRALLGWRIDQYISSVSETSLSRLLTALLSGSAAETCDALQETIQPIASQLPARSLDYAHHMFIVTALLEHAKAQELEVHIEHQTAGEGTGLVVALVDQSNSIAAVLDFERAIEMVSLPSVARAGLDQMIHRGYLSRLSSNIRQAKAFGLAFHRHNVSATCQHFQKQSRNVCDFAPSRVVSEHSR